MPELPEVETIRSLLEPALVGRRLEAVLVLDPMVTRPVAPELAAAALTGERVAAVRRRGKYLVFTFESGRHLLVHLRMTGSFRHSGNGLREHDPHRRAVVRLDDGSDVAYRDVRRFGRWLVLEPAELDAYLAQRLGPEPLDPRFTTAVLAAALAGRRAPLKAALLDQRVVAGLGNIYVDEALWRARLHPRRPAGSVERAGLVRLRRAIVQVLRQAIALGGTTLSDYVDPEGRSGRMRAELSVYGRHGLPCRRCGTLIERTRVAGRGTWFCPRCQKAP